jgi:hypothetical protein
MGPMRFPYTYKSASNVTYNITDHQLVFQLAAEMNKINNHDKNLSVDFIPWYQSSPNGLYYQNGIRLDNGMPPTVTQVSENSSLEVPSVLDASTQDLSAKIDALTSKDDFFVKMAQNMFEAHAEFLGQPGTRSYSSMICC